MAKLEFAVVVRSLQSNSAIIGSSSKSLATHIKLIQIMQYMARSLGNDKMAGMSFNILQSKIVPINVIVDCFSHFKYMNKSSFYPIFQSRINRWVIHLFSLLGVCSALISSDAHAGSWYWADRKSDGVPCASGFDCALQQYIYFYGQPSGPITCFYGYYQGNLSGAECERHPNPSNPGYSLSGYAMIRCDVGQVISASGCIPRIDPRSPPDCKNQAGDPVNIKEGVLHEEKIDYHLGENSPLQFKRYYYSDRIKFGGTSSSSRLGASWRSNFDVSIWYRDNPVSSFEAVVTKADGRQDTFQWSSASNSYVLKNTQGGLRKLSYANNTTTYTDEDDAIYTFGIDNTLQTIQQRGGYNQTLIWNGGVNTVVSDNLGRSMTFDYEISGLLKSIYVNSVKVVSFAYKNMYPIPNSSPAHGAIINSADTASFTISSVTWPQSPSGVNVVNYRYTDSRWPHVLTELIDERGIVISTWMYDSTGRVSQNSLAGNVGTFSFSYDTSNRTTTVTNPLAKKSVYSNTPRGTLDSTLMTSIAGQASTNCAASNAIYFYDTYGFLSSQTDEEGRKTTYVRDAQGRPTSITRGAP